MRAKDLGRQLLKVPYSLEFGEGQGDYLLHLTRLIDRTTDLYNFQPVVPIDKLTIDKSNKILIRACFPKVRVKTAYDHVVQNWSDLVDQVGGRAAKSSPEKLSNFLEQTQSELAMKPNSNEYSQLEASLGFDELRWKQRTKNIISDTFRTAGDLNVKHTALFLPEFCFPPIQDHNKRNVFMKDLRNEYLNAKCSTGSASLENLRDFMFLGSFHDTTNGHNLGVSFPFGVSPLDSKVRLGYQHQGDDGIYLQRKRHASKKLGEVLSPISTLDFPVFVTDFGRVAVLICSDIYDLSLFMGLVRYNLRCLPGGEIDYILVPAFNRSRKLVEACRQLSFLMNTTIVYATSFRNEPNRDTSFSKDTHCFICGRDADDLQLESHDIDMIANIVSARSSWVGDQIGGFGYTDYVLDPKGIANLRLMTRKRYSKAIQEGSRRTYTL